MKTLQSGPFLIGVYENGYKPTLNLRIWKQSLENYEGTLQQLWRSDCVGFDDVWRDVPIYTPPRYPE